jgi:hypothetical protein
MIEFQEAVDRIANRVPVENRLSDIVSDTPMLRTGPATTGRTQHRPYLLAAACIALLATAGAVLATRQPDATGDSNPAPPPTAVPAGVPEPLLMLPADPTAEPLSGQIYPGRIGQRDGTISLVGHPNGAGEYTDLFTISLLGQAPELDSPTAITLTNGPASIVENGSVTIVQQRDGQWILVNGWIDRSVATNAAQQATVSANGSLAIPPGEFEILTTQTTLNEDLVTAVFNTTNGLTVNTCTCNDAPVLYDLLRPVPSAARITVRGHPGWRLTIQEQGAREHHTISWMETPDRTVTVDGTGSVDTLLALANSLEVVDYPTWFRAVGDPSRTDPNAAEQALLTEEARTRLAEATRAAEEANP